MAAENQNQGQQMPETSSKMPVMAIVIVVVILLGAGAYYLFSRPSTPAVDQVVPTEPVLEEDSVIEDEEATGEGVMEEETEDDSSIIEEEVREIAVDGEEYDFSPSSITVTEGETVRIAFTNVGTFPHNFVIDELGVSTQTIQPGDTDTVEFTADQSGTFAFYCSVGNHRAQGMEGDLEVE